MVSKISAKTTSLVLKASQVLRKSYSPYSKYSVGAAILAGNGKIYTGTNVENSSYGATICAERSAICAAISDGAKDVREVVVVTKAASPWPPCGICLQVMAEFMKPTGIVHLANGRGIQKSFTLKELLPQAFGPNYLQK
jgi:cytidine deaminase